MHTVRWSRRIVPLAGVLALIASCRNDQQSITEVPHINALITATTVTLSPTADTRINIDAVNYSTDTILTLYTWPAGQVANAILMKFDLSSIPAGATVSSATLSMYQTDADATADPTYTATVHRIINHNPNLAQATGYTFDGVQGWTPNACCFNNVPLAQADISAPVATQNLDKTNGVKQWGVTSLIQGWLNTPSTNFGLLVNSDASKLADHWRVFGSSEHPIPSQRPTLTVTYTTAVSNPGTVTDLSVVSTTTNSATIRFTEVDDGTGQPAKYNVRFAVTPISWGSATDVTQGTCATPVLGTAIGAVRTCTVQGLASATAYDFQLVAFRGTLNQDAVFGGLSNVAQGTTTSGSGGGGWSHEPFGLTLIHETGWEDGTLGPWTVYNQEPSKIIHVIPVPDSPIGEQNALEILYAAGHVGGGGAEARFEIGSQPHELFVGYWVQVNPTWQGHTSAINKMVFLQDSDPSFSAMWYEMFGAGSEPLGLFVVNQSGPNQPGYHENVTPVDFTRGQWHKVEIYQKQGSPGIVRVWVDGVLAIDRSDVITRNAPLSAVAISGIWGGVGDSKAHADYMRFDRIHISGR